MIVSDRCNVCASSEIFVDSQSMACEGELGPDWSILRIAIKISDD